MANLKVGNTNITRMSVIEPYDDSTPSDNDEVQPWVRPDYWLDMPTFASGDDKVAVLIFVPSGNPLDVKFEIRGQYISSSVTPTYSTVDWGDGNTTIVSGTHPTSKTNPDYINPPYHVYNFEDLPESTEFIKGGAKCRQALIQVDNSVSGMYYLNLGDFDYAYKPGRNDRANNLHTYNTLDIKVQSSGMSSFNQNTGIGRHQAERMEIQTDQTIEPLRFCAEMDRLQSLSFPSGAFSGKTYARYMFMNCKSLKSIPYFDSSSFTDCLQMFQECRSLESLPDLDISNNTRFEYFLSNAKSLKEIPDFDYSNGTLFHRAFNGMDSIKSVPGINFQNLSAADYMFSECRNLERVEDGFAATNATTFRYIFQSCPRLQRIPTIELPNATDIRRIFEDTSLKDITFGDISNVTDFYGACQNNPRLEKVTFLYPEDINFSVRCDYGFNNTALKHAPYMNLSSCPSMQYLFNSCQKMVSAPAYDFSSAQYCTHMFRYCYQLKKFGGFRNLNQNAMLDYFFSECISLKEFPSGVFDSASSCPAYARNIFFKSPIKSIPDVNLSNLTTSVVAGPFREMYDLEDFGNIEFGSGLYLDYLFYGCNKIKVLPDWNVSGVEDFNLAFWDCRSLEWSDILGTKCDVSYYNCHLSSGALENIFNNLQSGVSSKTIDVRQNYGSYELHSDTIAIATSKGWTVTT